MATSDTRAQHREERKPGILGGTTFIGVVAASASFVLLVAFSPAVHSLFWSPKAAVVPLLAFVGTLVLVQAIRQGHPSWTDASAVLFLVIAAASAATAPNRTTSVFGQYRLGTGLIFVVALVGAWALGRSLNGRDRHIVCVALVAGLGVNLMVALAETVVDLSSFQLFLTFGRAPGLLGNPIHLGAVAAASAAALVGSDTSDRTRWAASVASGAALQIAGGRAPLLVVAIALAVGALRRRRATIIVAFGLLLGVAAGTAFIAVGSGTAATGRLTETGPASGYVARAENWLSARHAVADRPVLGSGPGAYGGAVSPYRTERLARAEEADVLFTDAHNIVVEYAVTTGLLGVTLFCLWLARSIREGAGAWMWFAIALLAGHLLQPQFVGTTPLAFLALGAGAKRSFRRSPVQLPRVAVAAALTGAFAAGAALLMGDWLLRQSELDFDLARAKEADRLLPRWADTADQIAKLAAFDAIAVSDDPEFREATRWRRITTDREPEDPHWWILLAELQLVRQETSAAEASFRRALSANPHSARALLGRATALLLLGRSDEADATLSHAERVVVQPAQKRQVEVLRNRVRREAR